MTINASLRAAALAGAIAATVSLAPPALAQAGGNKSVPTMQTVEASDAATKAATAWLQLTDAGKYPESWNQASKDFRGAISSSDWAAALTSVRTPLGAPTARVLKSADFKRDLPNAPPGEYVILQFDTAFEKRLGAVETVVAARDPDGAWRVSGYFIK
ncbi:DUF4019 domain-containing protein [Roseateles aquatilis]|nr:DUF4019 domain-containing protein [Roseateles aquatilis]